ncbi:MAG: hypothetical protein K2O29_08810 [Ruminococcus sp.]|nr:hypothetical protein [Ruminococcus sp.]
MDDKFCLFENWFKLQKDRWSDIEITVTNTSYEKATKTYYHNYKIELSSENSEGTIQLFENNDIYWVDLECVNFDKDFVYPLIILKVSTIFLSVSKNLKQL